nr:terpene synthase family protein [Nonomuraea sp. FMUSA5-5]
MLVFAVDRLIDEEATSREQVSGLIAACLTAAGGPPPVADEASDGASDGAPDGAVPGASDAAAFLAELHAELRAELGATPEPGAAPREQAAELEAAWREELARMLGAMAREWDWRRAARLPGAAQYLANADSCGAYFVALTLWISTGQVRDPRELERLRPAGEAVQRYLRLLNDVATRNREARSGDLNAFTLGLGPDEVNERMTALAAQASELIEPLRQEHPRAASYLDWQIHYSAGFYELADFWAEAAS